MDMRTPEQIRDALKSVGINHYVLDTESKPGVVDLTFNRVHWFSFKLKAKIERFKNCVPYCSPIAVVWKYKETSKK